MVISANDLLNHAMACVNGVIMWTKLGNIADSCKVFAIKIW